MEKNFTPVNEFVARGIVQFIGRSNFGGRVLRLLVKERRNTLTLNLSLEEGVARGIGRKDRVVVKGYTRAYSFHNDALDKDSSVMYFVATDVKRDTPELAQRFGENMGLFYPEPVFRAFISGRVTEAITLKNGAWGQITVETCGGGRDLRPSFVVLRYYMGGRLPVFDYEPGDIICTRLSAFTPIKKSDKGREYIFQNLVVEDIAYLDKKNKQKGASAQGDVLPVDLGLEADVETVSDEELMQQELAALAGDDEMAVADDSALMGDI